MTVSSRLLPQTRTLSYDGAAIKSGDPEQLASYLRDLVNDISKMYFEIVSKLNQGPEYMSQSSQPSPATNQVLVWKDTSTGNRYLMYNDAGTTVKVQLT